MKDETRYLLDDILSTWHQWARGYQHSAGINSSPMFRECRSNHRQWASLDEVADEDKSQHEAVDCIIMSMCPEFRTALQINAKNLFTGRNVWSSVRLPLESRAQILADARLLLTIKLQGAGIL